MRISDHAVHAANVLTASAVWIAVMSFFWIGFLSILAGKPFNLARGEILALITFAVYALDHVSGSEEDLMNNPNRAMLAGYHLDWIAIAAYIMAFVLAAHRDPEMVIPAVIIPGVAGGLYTVNIGRVRPKDLPAMKTLIVASSTSICRVSLVGGTPWLYALVFLMMIVDTVLCDLRDVPGDMRAGVKTIPVLIGRRRTLIVLAVICAALVYFSPLAAMSGLLLVAYFRKERHSLCYDLLVDGWVMFCWGLLHFFK